MNMSKSPLGSLGDIEIPDGLVDPQDLNLIDKILLSIRGKYSPETIRRLRSKMKCDCYRCQKRH